MHFVQELVYKWICFFRFQEFDLIESPQVKIFGSGPISYVTVIPTDRQLYGNYKCIATNSLGEAEHITQLREAFPPGPVAQVTINQHWQDIRDIFVSFLSLFFVPFCTVDITRLFFSIIQNTFVTIHRHAKKQSQQPQCPSILWAPLKTWVPPF